MNFAGAATTINMGTNATTLDLGDIRIKGNIVAVLNAPSPAATSCLSISEYVVNFLIK